MQIDNGLSAAGVVRCDSMVTSPTASLGRVAGYLLTSQEPLLTEAIMAASISNDPPVAPIGPAASTATSSSSTGCGIWAAAWVWGAVRCPRALPCLSGPKVGGGLAGERILQAASSLRDGFVSSVARMSADRRAVRAARGRIRLPDYGRLQPQPCVRWVPPGAMGQRRVPAVAGDLVPCRRWRW